MESSEKLWEKISKEIGLEGIPVTKASIIFSPNKAVKIFVEIESEEISENNEFITSLKEYKLVEVK